MTVADEIALELDNDTRRFLAARGREVNQLCLARAVRMTYTEKEQGKESLYEFSDGSAIRIAHGRYWEKMSEVER